MGSRHEFSLFGHPHQHHALHIRRRRPRQWPDHPGLRRADAVVEDPVVLRWPGARSGGGRRDSGVAGPGGAAIAVNGRLTVSVAGAACKFGSTRTPSLAAHSAS
ncbi:hypothetical protein [Amycolatopsis sp. lyj-90]|uniref:hypothetical protein n=1 Tax=Amycolatopsis sp. lyj-90 TaxID=2789285 RepID=UPI00397847BB